jgi:hypothetical protein
VSTTGAPAARHYHTALWTGSEMIIWGGQGDGGRYFNDMSSYIPDGGVFRITGVILNDGKLSLNFPTLPGRSYTLWQSETLAAGSWTNSGLPAVNGTGAILTFTVSAATSTRRFFRVQASQ